MSEEFQVKDSHSYRTEIPNIVFDLLLDPYEFRLYVEFKKIAGDDGECYRSRSKLCEKMKMGESKFKEAKKKLMEKRKEIGDQPLIEVQERFSEKGDRLPDLITIVDIWIENRVYFKEKFKGGSPGNPGVGRQETQGGSPGDRKEDPSKKIPLEEVVCPPTPCGGSAASKVTKKTMKGEEISINQSDFWAYAIKTKKMWSAELIAEAWELLVNYSAPINDLFRFLEGTIENLIKKKNFEKIPQQKIHKEEKECPYRKTIDRTLLEKDLDLLAFQSAE